MRDSLAARLEAALGPGAVVTEPRGDGSREERLTLHPSSAEAVAAAVAVCREARAALTPVGGGTHMEVGGPPSRGSLRLNLSRLSALIEHDDANLTVTAQAGMSAAGLAAVLRQRGQFAVLDTARPDRATLGGIVATNLNGYRRTAYRSIRDLVIGMRVVTGTGKIVKAGGKVVKNVAGYDMCKLFVGSLGTLGIITQVTARVEPLPEAEATLLLAFNGAERSGAGSAVEKAGTVAGRNLLPTALAVANRAAARRVSGEDRELVLVRLEGFPAVIERQEREIRAMTAEPRRLEGAAGTAVWDRLLALGWDSQGGLIRMTVPRSELPGAWGSLARTIGDGEMAADLLSGTIWLAPEAEAFARVLETLGPLVERTRGHLLIARIPPGVPPPSPRHRWRPAPAALPLMSGLKNVFDPDGILNPGLFLV